MKRIELERTAACEGFRLQYSLLSDQSGFLIQCVAFDCNGRLVSQYCTEKLCNDYLSVVSFFRLLVENCVFPVHIREILSDCGSDYFLPVSA